MDTTLPHLMKQARGEKTQQEFADRFKVSRQLVYLWEHGLSTPNDSILKALGIVREYKSLLHVGRVAEYSHPERVTDESPEFAQ